MSALLTIERYLVTLWSSFNLLVELKCYDLWIYSQISRHIVTRKLVGTLLLANTLLVCIMSGVLYWSFQHGATNSLQDIEAKSLQKLSSALIGIYREEGSWDFLVEDRKRWGIFLQILPGGSFSLMSEEVIHDTIYDQIALKIQLKKLPLDQKVVDSGWQHSSVRQVHDRPRPDSLSISARLRLVDKERRYVTGMWDQDLDANVEMLQIPLKIENVIVGYLEFAPQKWVEDGLNSHFEKKLLQSLLFSAIIAFLFSVLVALPLGQVVLGSIRKLIRGVRHLAEGNLAWRIEAGTKDEFGDLIANVNNLALQLEETESTRRSMMADVSHELRTPIAVLQAEVEAIQDGIRPCTIEQMNSLHKTIADLSMLVDNLFTLSLADSGGLTCQKTPCDAVSIMDRTFSLYKNLFHKKNIKFSYKLPAEAHILGDMLRLNQVFSNLLNNSYHYTDKKGEIKITAETSDDNLVIQIQDSAPGVSTENLQNIFNRLFRVDKSRSRSLGGAGLGLSLCQSIIETHQGEIVADHSPLGGVLMTITLPLYKK